MDALLPEKLERLSKSLEPFHKKYDPLLRMLRVPFQTTSFRKVLNGLPLHPTRESLRYAAALLDTGDPRLQRRGVSVLSQILRLQERNPSCKNYGYWPKYLEDRSSRIVPLDENWCEFLGKHLIRIKLNHSSILSEKLVAQLDAAILLAARTIQRRNVPIDYTNIAVLGIYVALMTAQIYGVEDLHAYGLTRLRQFHARVSAQGGFDEYNSPTYTVITLTALGYCRLHIMDPEAKSLIEDIYYLAWEEIAWHFHAPTRQWSGPHSRSYSVLLEQDVLALIERSTPEWIKFGISETCIALDEHWLTLPCPPTLEAYFLPLKEPRTVSRTLTQKSPHQTLTTYLTPTFSLGTISYSDFWEQRRPLLAYWGSSDNPSYLRLRCLRDGVDFAAAQFFSVQHEGQVLGGVSFANDLNWGNPYKDKNPTSKNLGKSLCLCFEFGGVPKTFDLKNQVLLPTDVKPGVQLFCNGLYFQIVVLYAQFGEHASQWKIHQKGDRLYLNLLLWSEKTKKFYFDTLSQGGIGFAFQMASENPSLPSVLVGTYDGWLEMNWDGLRLKFRNQPANQASLNAFAFPALFPSGVNKNRDLGRSP